LIRALIDAIRFVKTKKADTLATIKKHCTELPKMQNDEEWSCYYETQAASLEAKPHLTLDAIQNVSLWRLRKILILTTSIPCHSGIQYLREIDDSDISTGCTPNWSVVDT
jgi:hypothetical protein